MDHFWNIGSRENKVLKLVRVIYLLWIYEVLKSYIWRFLRIDSRENKC